MSRRPRNARHVGRAPEVTARQYDRQVEELSIDDVLIPNSWVKRFADDEIGKAEGFISEFGLPIPLPIDERGKVLGGLQFLLAARRLGLQSIPTIRIDDLDETAAEYLQIAWAKFGEQGEWNEEGLREALARLPELDLDERALGFDTAEVDRILSIGSAVDEDDAPVEPPPEAIVRRGDTFQIGAHRIRCGDATNRDDAAALMGGQTARLAICDPGYGVAINGHVSSTGRHREFVQGAAEMSPNEHQEHLRAFLSVLTTKLYPGAIVYVSMDWRGIARLIAAAEACGLELINICVWVKTNAGMGSLYRSQHEFYAVLHVPGGHHINNVQLGRFGRSRSNVWTYPGANQFSATRDEDLAIHPTVKPAELIADAIKDTSRRGQIVVDFFGGSGTTMIAAEMTGRIAYLMELDPAYVEASLLRFEKRFGVEAIHVETGKTLKALREERSASSSEKGPRRRRRKATS